MSSIDLEYLCTTIGNLCGTPVRIYQGHSMSFFHSIVAFPKDPIMPYEQTLLELQKKIGYYITEDFDYYGIIRQAETRLIIGPARLTPQSEQDMRKSAFALCVAPEEVSEYVEALKSIVPMPLESILQVLCTMNHVMTGEKLTLNDLEILEDNQLQLSRAFAEDHDLPPADDNLSTADAYNSYQVEQQMLDIIRRGDTAELEKWMKSAPAVRPGSIARDMLRQMKNTFIISTTLVCRSAIRGGMNVDDAFSLSDSYIQKCEQLHNVEQIFNLQYHMVKQYTEQVEALRYQRNQSELITNVASYVRHHLSDAIKTEEIADALYISRSHLSTKFKDESGMNLSDYIHYIKISEAKYLLKYTDKTILLISSYLGYSSQSHFCRVFKRIADISPLEYRERHKK